MTEAALIGILLTGKTELKDLLKNIMPTLSFKGFFKKRSPNFLIPIYTFFFFEGFCLWYIHIINNINYISNAFNLILLESKVDNCESTCVIKRKTQLHTNYVTYISCVLLIFKKIFTYLFI